MRADRLFGKPITQVEFDRYLEERMERFGRNNCWALSLAFFNAAQYPPSKLCLDMGREKPQGTA